MTSTPVPPSATPYPRDLVGYGPQPPQVQWPGGARLAVQFVLNYEEGGESNVLHGDPTSEVFLSEIVGAQAYPERHMSMESMYEYGSRVGVWRLLGEFERRGLPLTVFAVATALQRHPALARHLVEAGHEVACHGLKWVHHQHMPEATERAHIAEATRLLRELAGPQWPLGWYTGRDSPQTRRLVLEHGGYEYDSDCYSDDLPFWTRVTLADGRVLPRLMLPYTLDCNDMRFVQAQGFNTGAHFLSYLQDSFDVLYAESAQIPRMMSIGMHCRLLGRPGRFGALQKFLDHVQRHDQVWVCRRIDIARHWQRVHPFAG